MPYLGRSPGSGVRSRFIYAATSGQTSFSGNDSNSVSLAYEDTLYMDVYQNGVLLKPVTDYAATTGTSVVLTTGATTDDVVEMIVYDTFAVADTVSASNGGTFSGDVAVTANANFGDSNKAQFGAGNDLQIYHDGSNSYIDEQGTGNLLIRGTEIQLKASDGTSYAEFNDGGATNLRFSGDLKFSTASTGVDIIGAFTATDGCTITTADNSATLTLTSTDADGSEGPRLDLRRDSGSPADGDILGTTRYTFDNDAAEVTEAVRIEAILQDASDGTEDAKYQIEQMFGGGLFSFQVMSKDGIVFNENSQDIDFRVESNGNTDMIKVDAGNDRVGIGLASPAVPFEVFAAANSFGIRLSTTSGNKVIDFLNNNSSGDAEIRGYYNNNSGTQAEGFRLEGNENSFLNPGTSNTGLLIGKSSSNTANAGVELKNDGFFAVTRDGGRPVLFRRNSDDGQIVQFNQDATEEGGISVSGSTVSYNGGHLARWSRLADNSKDTSIVKGTVLTNLDQMVVWSHSDELWAEGDDLPDGVSVGDVKTAAYTENNEQLNCMAVSSVEGDTNVAGVFVNWDDRDAFNDMNVAMTGDMVIRIAQGTTVARGNLLMSAGDGTAKPQGDSYVQDKTIAKVTSTTVSHTYDDGSYLVPCVLMAC